MNAPSKIAAKLATEIGKPERADFIERQYGMNAGAKALRDAWVGHWFPDAPRLGTYDRTKHDADLEFAKRVASNCLSDEERVRLAIYLIDSVERIGDDLRVEAESVLADVLSSVRF
ncbi:MULTISPECIES: hypothetical protein [Alphaproteobacteria]|uniref:hypothetical protein n=1 Tax=Sphingopyxis sp. TaxID=1908224 RepID=UPI004034485D